MWLALLGLVAFSAVLQPLRVRAAKGKEVKLLAPPARTERDPTRMTSRLPKRLQSLFVPRLASALQTPAPRSAATQSNAIMNFTLLKAMVALVPTGMVFSGSIVLFFRERSLGAFLQLIGAGCLVMVVLTHFCEALRLFPWMQWGGEHSIGHYLDIGSAVVGLTLFPIGYLAHALTKRRA
jgi:hypothetical protein